MRDGFVTEIPASRTGLQGSRNCKEIMAAAARRFAYTATSCTCTSRRIALIWLSTRRSPRSTSEATPSTARSPASSATRSTLSIRCASRCGSAPACDDDKLLDDASQERALACLAALRRAPARFRPPRGARGRHQHAARREERARVPQARAGGARLPDRGHRRTRGSAPHLLGVQHSLPPSHGEAPRRRHRRRLDRIHHRLRLQAAEAREPLHGLRELQPAVLSRRAGSPRGA